MFNLKVSFNYIIKNYYIIIYKFLIMNFGNNFIEKEIKINCQ